VSRFFRHCVNTALCCEEPTFAIYYTLIYSLSFPYHHRDYRMGISKSITACRIISFKEQRPKDGDVNESIVRSIAIHD
jgi:hypothetical protein